MDDLLVIAFPFLLLTARIGAFLASCPVFGASSVPAVVKTGLVFWMSVFFAVLLPPPSHVGNIHWMNGALMMTQEILVGLAVGLGARMIFAAIQQGGSMIAQQMGLADAGVIDPSTGEESETISTFLEVTLTVAFLAGGGHQLLIRLLARTYVVFPLGGTPDLGGLKEGLITAGSTMLNLGLALAAPMIAAFMVLSVVLAILARALPEMNILFESFPLRVGLGLAMTAAMFPSMSAFINEMSRWMNGLV